jgi:uncharacterized protein HemX
MDGKKVTIVGIIAILIGLLLGYLFWGAPSKSAQGELDQLKARLTEAQKAVSREKELTDKLTQMEAQLKQLTDDLAKEKAKREQMQAQVSKGKK